MILQSLFYEIHNHMQFTVLESISKLIRALF